MASAESLLREDSPAPLPRSIQTRPSMGSSCLAPPQAEEADGGHARERKEKAAAWALRHAFDHVFAPLSLKAVPHGRRPTTPPAALPPPQVLTWIAYDSMPSGCTGCSVC